MFENCSSLAANIVSEMLNERRVACATHVVCSSAYILYGVCL